MGPLISVVIPIYNVERYLCECINSVINQTYRDLEIILVDDGSTDSSPIICDEYVNIDDRITVYHKTNGGLSNARNFGFQHSCGDYVYFLDSDDYLETDAIFEMMKLSLSTDPDVIYMDATAFFESDYVGEKNQGYIRKRDYGLLSGEESLAQLLENNDFHYSVPLLLLKRSFMKNNRIMFCEGIIFEDVAFSFFVFSSAKRTLHYYKSAYHRRYRGNSIMTAQKATLSYESIEKVFFLLLNYCENKDLTKKWYAQKYLSRVAKNVIMKFNAMQKNDRNGHKKEYNAVLRSIKKHLYFNDKALLLRVRIPVLWEACRFLHRV